MNNRIEKVAGVCPVLYKPDDPTKVLIVRELADKELTGKLAGMWGIGYETVEDSDGENGESHRQAISRFFDEEMRILSGRMLMPEHLSQTKLAIVRISPPHMAAWVHAYAFPVTEDFAATRGAFQDEVDGPVWIDCEAILDAERGRNRVIFRAGTYEIVKSHLVRLANPGSGVVIEPNPINLPPWEFFRLRERGINREEALSQVGVDPRLLQESHSLIHSLLQSQNPLSVLRAPIFSLSFLP